MRRVPVRSTSGASLTYNSKKRELQVEFRESGENIPVFNVPLDEYEAFLVAKSKGKYLNEVFKKRNQKPPQTVRYFLTDTCTRYTLPPQLRPLHHLRRIRPADSWEF